MIESIDELNKAGLPSKQVVEEKSREEELTNFVENVVLIYNSLIEYNNVRLHDTYNFCIQLTSTRLFRLVHFLSRLADQFIRGTITQKVDFLKWLFRSNQTKLADARYQPLLAIADFLEASDIPILVPTPDQMCDLSLMATWSYYTAVLRKESVRCSDYMLHIVSQYKHFIEVQKRLPSPAANELRKLIETNSYVGVLLYPHVVPWEPLQTPQQLLRKFAQKNWLCLYCVAEQKNSIKLIEQNIYATTEEDVVLAIDESIKVTVLLTWMASLPFVDNIKNKQVWYHILDQIDIFSLYDKAYVTAHEIAVSNADWVSYVSRPLTKYVSHRADAIYLPNGCNPEELVCNDVTIPSDISHIINRKNPIVGYYGVIALWMDLDLIRSVALKRPNYEFVFIGDKSVDTSQIDKLHNIHLLGPKEYSELPSYAIHFDVGIIPFVENEMMDCVSQIKFYEYCAYGMPIIASKMRELEKYAGQCIACVSGVEQFIEKLDIFIKPEIAKAARRIGSAIAYENTWENRVNEIEPTLLK